MFTVPPKPPIRHVRLGPADVAVERRADGVVVLRSPHALGEYPDKLTERLAFWAAAAPDRVLFAKRDPACDPLLGLGANYAGIPYAPVSPAYSLISTDFGKLRHVANLLYAPLRNDQR
jgi:feruloyl-CoA synthase